MSESNPNSRLETFCDGVFAIATTLLIIDIRIPSTATINSSDDLWQAIKHIAPSISAFVLSFIVIFITWVNHHNGIKLVNKSCGSFIYANGLLLLAVVFVPFPTSLVGENISTDHAAPAVILYDTILALQALAWILIYRTAIKNHLGKNESSILAMHKNGRFGLYAFFLYSLCAIIAIWFPLAIFVITGLTWIFWLIIGTRMKDAN